MKRFLYPVAFAVGVCLMGCSQDHSAAKKHMEALTTGQIVYDASLHGAYHSIFLICREGGLVLVVLERDGLSSLNVKKREYLTPPFRCDSKELSDPKKHPDVAK